MPPAPAEQESVEQHNQVKTLPGIINNVNTSEGAKLIIASIKDQTNIISDLVRTMRASCENDVRSKIAEIEKMNTLIQLNASIANMIPLLQVIAANTETLTELGGNGGKGDGGGGGKGGDSTSSPHGCQPSDERDDNTGAWKMKKRRLGIAIL